MARRNPNVPLDGRDIDAVKSIIADKGEEGAAAFLHLSLPTLQAAIEGKNISPLAHFAIGERLHVWIASRPAGRRKEYIKNK